MSEEEIEKLRGVIRDCVSKHLYSSAIFFADKVAALTSDPADIYTQAQALFLGRHYRHAFHLLNASKIVFRDLRFRYLAAKCLAQKPRPVFLPVVNLAHALRKLRYHVAITYYENALALSTRSLSTFAGLAYTYHLQGNYTAAITFYHKALWLKHDDQFYMEMLAYALVDESGGGIDPVTESRRGELFP